MILTKLLKEGYFHSYLCRIIKCLRLSRPEQQFNSCYQYLIIQLYFNSFCRFAEQVLLKSTRQPVTQLQTSIQKASKNYKTIELQRLVVNRFHSNKPKERCLINCCCLVATSQSNTRTSYLQALLLTKCKLFYDYFYFMTFKTLTNIKQKTSVFLSSISILAFCGECHSVCLLTKWRLLLCVFEVFPKRIFTLDFYMWQLTRAAALLNIIQQKSQGHKLIV